MRNGWGTPSLARKGLQRVTLHRVTIFKVLSFEFKPPDTPWSTNQDRNLNPHERAKKIKLWKTAARVAYRQARFGRIEPGVVQVTIPFGQNRRRDPHNYCGTILKAIIDGLVLEGAWPDDTPEYVGHREPILYKGDMVKVTIYEA